MQTAIKGASDVILMEMMEFTLARNHAMIWPVCYSPDLTQPVGGEGGQAGKCCFMLHIQHSDYNHGPVTDAGSCHYQPKTLASGDLHPRLQCLDMFSFLPKRERWASKSQCFCTLIVHLPRPVLASLVKKMGPCSHVHVADWGTREKWEQRCESGCVFVWLQLLETQGFWVL